jgi:hypothetical protein
MYMFDDTFISNLDNSHLHIDSIKMLKLYNKNTLPHILLYGPKNSGKKTLIHNYIKYLFNLDELSYQIKEYHIKINNNDVKITVKQSIYFMEINLWEYGLYDRHVLSKFIKEYAINKSVTNNYRIIIMNNLGRVSKSAQLSLRRMLETLITSTRFIFSAYSIDKLDEAIISRCYSIRIPYPKKKELYNYISSISVKNSLNLSNDNINKIIKLSNKDLFNINMMIINCSIEDNEIKNPLRSMIIKIHESIIVEGLEFIDNIRIIIYKCHLLNYNDANIIKEYIYYISDKNIFNNREICNIIQEAALNEHKSVLGKKPFYNLEKLFIFIKRILIQKSNK